MANVTLNRKDFKAMQKMTSRPQILIFLAVCSLGLDKTGVKDYDVRAIQTLTNLSVGTIKDALRFLVMDGHVRKADI